MQSFVYAECHHIQSVVMLQSVVIQLTGIIPNVVILNVVAPSRLMSTFYRKQ